MKTITVKIRVTNRRYKQLQYFARSWHKRTVSKYIKDMHLRNIEEEK